MSHTRQGSGHSTEKRERSVGTRVSRTSSVGRAVIFHAGDSVAEVPVSKARLKSIAADLGAVGKLISTYADTAALAKRTGQPVRVTYVVTPDGKAEADPPAGAEGPDAKLGSAIARAKARGAAKVAEILRRPDMLNARDFGPLIGTSHETVNAKRRRDELLGLEGATRGVRYPRWQVTERGLPLPGLARLFGILGRQPWSVYRFLLTEHPELGGRTAVDALKSGHVDAVLNVAENTTAGAFS